MKGRAILDLPVGLVKQPKATFTRFKDTHSCAARRPWSRPSGSTARYDELYIVLREFERGRGAATLMRRVDMDMDEQMLRGHTLCEYAPALPGRRRRSDVLRSASLPPECARADAKRLLRRALEDGLVAVRP